MKRAADLRRSSLPEFGKISPPAARFQPIMNTGRPDRCRPAEPHTAYSPGSTRYGKDVDLDTLQQFHYTKDVKKQVLITTYYYYTATEKLRLLGHREVYIGQCFSVSSVFF